MKHNNKIEFKKLDLPNILNAAANFSHKGRLLTTPTLFTYLDIDDNYIHQLYPLLQENNVKIEMPDYFSPGLIGAHITVVYPEENKKIPEEELGREYSFTITDIVTADLGLKRYYALAVQAPELIKLRHKFGLGDKLCFKNYWVGLHITIGVYHLLETN